MFEKLVTVLTDAGGSMMFPAYVAEARARGLRPELWLRASHAGVLYTRFDDVGNVVIVAGAKPAPPQGV